MKKIKRYIQCCIPFAVLAIFATFSGCDNGKETSKATGEVRIDTLASDSSLHNGNLEMEKDNTITKDSAATREDLGGGSE